MKEDPKNIWGSDTSPKKKISKLEGDQTEKEKDLGEVITAASGELCGLPSLQALARV